MDDAVALSGQSIKGQEVTIAKARPRKEKKALEKSFTAEASSGTLSTSPGVDRRIESGIGDICCD